MFKLRSRYRNNKGPGGLYLGLWRAHEQMAQPHGPEQAISPGEVGISLHHKGVALHKGAQVHHGLKLGLTQPSHDALIVLLGSHFQRPLL